MRQAAGMPDAAARKIVAPSGGPDREPAPLRNGAPRGFAELYQQEWVSMVRLATLILGDQHAGEDVVQEAFVNIYRRWDKVTDETARARYLRVAVLNGSRSALRKRAVASRGAAQLAAFGSTDTAASPEPAGEVLAALGRLPRRQREVLILRYWLDLSEEEIARTLSISRGTVKSSAARGLSGLQQRLEDSR